LYAAFVMTLLTALCFAQTPTQEGAPPPQSTPAQTTSPQSTPAQTTSPQNTPAPATSSQTNPQTAQPNQPAATSGQIGFAPGTVLLAELTKSIDAKKAKQGDPVDAKTAIDLTRNGQVVVPKGAKLVGHVTDAKPKQKGESDSSLSIAFDE